VSEGDVGEWFLLKKSLTLQRWCIKKDFFVKRPPHERVR
jgi:hypothetical protein